MKPWHPSSLASLVSRRFSWKVPLTQSSRSVLRLWPRVRPFRRGLYIALVALLLAAVITLAFPLAVRYLLDAAFVHHDRVMLDRIALGLLAAFAVQAVSSTTSRSTSSRPPVSARLPGCGASSSPA